MSMFYKRKPFFILCFVILFSFISCGQQSKTIDKPINTDERHSKSGVSLVVLGTAQDAGSPHIGCKKECCATLFEHSDTSRKVVSLGVVDHTNQQCFLFEATPDITFQLKELQKSTSWKSPEFPNGIFLTHAHIGHYTGLMYLGKEAVNTSGVPVYAMPKMKGFLENNGPWSQLVKAENIRLKEIQHKREFSLTPNLSIQPFTVPHRDEYSETVGYKIIGPSKAALFIPDINKWSVWDTNIAELVKTVDYAFLDATFYDGEEINNRDISEIPHPFVIESMVAFETLSKKEKSKIYFIHFNHTNPLLKKKSEQTKTVLENGFKIARKGMKLQL